MEYAFLPQNDPLVHLPKVFCDWENLAKNLPKYLLASDFKQRISRLPTFPIDQLKTTPELERAMQILSYLGHAYVWGEKEIPQRLPEVLAKPWYAVSQQLGRPPVLSYASYALHNYRRLDPAGPVALGNIALIQNFLGGIDEEWFILIHVDIEAKSLPAMKACIEAIEAVNQSDPDALLKALMVIQSALENICQTLDRMPEHCDPYIYYHRVRPYIHGWKNHPAFPDGLIYAGVAEFDHKPQQFRGETGAQSAIVPSLDALLGIRHATDDLRHYLMEMRQYMPPAHRQFVEYIEKNSDIRASIQQKWCTIAPLKAHYNHCVQLIERFRQTHLAYASSYIQKQSQNNTGNPNAIGTGGTPFIKYLKKHKDETLNHLL